MGAKFGSLGQYLDDSSQLRGGDADLVRRAAAPLTPGAPFTFVLERQERFDIDLHTGELMPRESLLVDIFRRVRSHRHQEDCGQRMPVDHRECNDRNITGLGVAHHAERHHSDEGLLPGPI